MKISTDFETTGQTLIPDLLASHPEARKVFDRYGLSGCGGELGPHETIQFFSRTHGVDEAQLLGEIAEAIQHGTAEGDQLAAPSVADTIYRRFFLAGIAVVLTAGASWGAWILWSIGMKGEFTGVSVHQINAHGHAQIFGWVGLFIMGFAYQAFPRIWHSTLAAPRLAVAVFAAMLVGIIVRTIGMAAPATSWGVTANLAGGTLEITAITLFALQLLATFRKSGAKLEPYVGFALTALAFFILQAVLSVWHSWRIMTATTAEALIAQVATWQAPLRDLQIHGLALFMILGVSQRMLPALFELPKIAPRRAWSAWAILLVAVLAETGIFLAYRATGNHIVAAFLMIPWVMLAVGCAMIAWPWKLWRPLRTPDGSPDRMAKFIRVAWGWLAVSLVMLLLLPAYQAMSGIPFSHAYYGAIRHAITVGFISMMIMGFAAKVAPTLAGIDPRTLPALWAPFILVNLGCFLRVSTQTLTDFYPVFFGVIGVSGILEVTGLAIWGAHLTRIMLRSRAAGQQAYTVGAAPSAIEAQHTPAQVIHWFPQTLPVFESHGFGIIKNPVLRNTVARRVTLAVAAGMHGVSVDAFLHDLNQAAFGTTEQCGMSSDCGTCKG